MAFWHKRRAAPPPAPPAPAVTLAAMARGRVVPMAQLPDDMFAQGVLGPCCGIEPEEGRVFAPADGTVVQTAPERYALSLCTAEGVQVLLHAGVDTIGMHGAGFVLHVQPGQAVRRGQLLLEADLGRIRAAGHPTVVILAVENSEDFSAIRLAAAGRVAPGDALLHLTRQQDK